MALFAWKLLIPVKLRRRRVASVMSVGNESLEARVLLAAEFSLANGSITKVWPYITDQVYLIAPFAVLEGQNGSSPTVPIVIQGILSSDQVWGNGDDSRVGSVSVDVQLGARSGSMIGFASVAEYRAASFLLLKVDSPEPPTAGDAGDQILVISLQGLPSFAPSSGQTTGKTNKFITVDPGISLLVQAEVRTHSPD